MSYCTVSLESLESPHVVINIIKDLLSTVNQPRCLDSISHCIDLPVGLVELRWARPPGGPGLSWGCRTRPPACLCGRPAGLSRPPPPADGLTGPAAGAPARAGPSPAGHSDAQSPGSSPVPGVQQINVWCTSGCAVGFRIHPYVRSHVLLVTLLLPSRLKLTVSLAHKPQVRVGAFFIYFLESQQDNYCIFYAASLGKRFEKQ